MNRRCEHNNRRSNSQILPRLYLLLQIVILVLISYISFVLLKSVGLNELFVYLILGVANTYFSVTFFFRCKFISHRSRYTSKFGD